MTRRATYQRRSQPTETAAQSKEDTELMRGLARLQRAIFKYPLATQAVFSALVEQGRQFAETEEGAQWEQRLRNAEQMGRARMLWEVLSLNTFTERNDNPLPSTLVDNLVQALRAKRLEPVLSRIFEGRFRR